MSEDALAWQRICPAQSLQESAAGIRFELDTPVGLYAAFVLRIAGLPRAWLNQCRHVAIELDWLPGQFLDAEGAIMCAAHGATYDPRSGACRSGPCRGRGLIPLQAREHQAWVEVRREVPTVP